MKTIVAEQDRLSELERWRGAPAAVWIFQVTHKRLALRLWRPGEPTVLYLVGVACEHIAGPFAWESSDISIRSSTSNHEEIVDERAGFSLRCSSVTLATGPATDPDKSFDHFLGDSEESYLG